MTAMRTRTLVLGVGAAALFGLLSGPRTGAGDKEKGEKLTPEQIMELVEKLGKPGPDHKVLEPLAGEFTCEVKIYTAPGKPALESKATATRRWILGGRFLSERYDGEAFGKPFQGFGWIGFDNAKKKYTVAWIDSMSTAITPSLGTYDVSTKTFTYVGEENSPFYGGKVKMRDLVRIVDNDTHVLEMYRQPAGAAEFKTIEITCKRKAKS
jgi:hypothetical protein